ncbi:MAG: putative SyrP-like regulatory protein, partial [Nitrospira sp. OLB3]
MNQEKGTAYAPQVGVNGHANGQGGLAVGAWMPDGNLPLLVTPLEERRLEDYLDGARRMRRPSCRPAEACCFAACRSAALPISSRSSAPSRLP